MVSDAVLVGIAELFFLVFVLVVVIYFITRRYLPKSVVNKRLEVLFNITRKFYATTAAEDMGSFVSELLLKSSKRYRAVGFYLLNRQRAVVSSNIFDRVFKSIHFSVSPSLLDAVDKEKHYAVFTASQVALNNYFSFEKKIAYKFAHIIKFKTDADLSGAYIFCTDSEKIEMSEYEFLRAVLDHFAFGLQSKRLSKQVDTVTKTLEVMEHTYQQIVDRLPLGVVVIDKNEKVLLWNDLMASMFSIKESDIKGKAVTNILYQEESKKTIRSLIEVSDKTDEIREVEYLQYLSPRGRKKIFMVICYKLFDVGIDSSFVLVFRDITEKFQLEQSLKEMRELKEKELQDKVSQATRELVETNIELKKLNDLKSEFVSVVSHELRTPLTSIRGYASLLQSKRLGKLNEQQLHSVDIISSEGERLSRLINDLLDLSKLESGKTNLHPVKADVVKNVKQVVTSLRVQAQAKQIRMTVIAKKGVKCVFDVEKIQQVFFNIIGNAIKFTPTSGSIRINIEEDKTYCYVAVSDTGIGMTAETMKRLFEPFFQIESHLKRSNTGTGLGLPISKHIIEMHHGRIDVESKLNKGSTFTIVIPKHVEHTQPTS